VKRWLMIVAVLTLAGCGDDEQRETAAPPTELTVTVHPKGDSGPADERTITDAGGLTAQDFKPVPDDQACTEIFGGPATAIVSGRLDGAIIDAQFSLNNGCEIARWKTAAPVLGDPPD
jgi:hypothetical protein